MKAIKNLVSIITILLLLSACSPFEKQGSDLPNKLYTSTPDILENNPTRKSSSIRKTAYKSSIINQLYKEALEKDTALNALNNAILQLEKDKNDSLINYQKYIRTNQQYWDNVKKLSLQISDSNLRKATQEAFRTIEDVYRNGVFKQNQCAKDIKKRKAALNDRHILMQLYITEAMIRNYQMSEKPDLKPMQQVLEQYNRLIYKTEKETKLKTKKLVK